MGSSTTVMLLVSGATRDVGQWPEVGVLLRPGSGISELIKSRPWAVDNAAFVGFDGDAFVMLLGSLVHRQAGCIFVAVPDVVGSHVRTLNKWRVWSPMIRALGFPLAFVAQDGCAVPDVPWDEINALFIGGTTEFKLSAGVDDLLAYAAARGKWRHVGRVNSRKRIKRFASRCDSADGSGFSRFGKRIRLGVNWIAEAKANPRFL